MAIKRWMYRGGHLTCGTAVLEDGVRGLGAFSGLGISHDNEHCPRPPTSM
jgi:hypothetical protein